VFSLSGKGSNPSRRNDMTKAFLSKSRFLAGLQCPLRLWYGCYEPELASERSPAQKARLETGHKVGELARDRYAGGTLIDEDRDHQKEAVRSTQSAVKSSGIPSIYEGAFACGGVFIRADIVERSGNGAWNLIEVKSGTKVKEENVYDVALQHHVLRGLGFGLEQAGILNLNREYVYDGGEHDLAALFTFTDLMEKVTEMHEEVADRIAELKGILRRTEPPSVDPSRHCHDPYGCEFYDHCRKRMPEHWVLDLWRIQKDQVAQLGRMGISDIHGIPDFFPLSAVQARIRKCVINDTDYAGPELKTKLKERDYPIHFLDFETIAPAIPRYANTSPYQKLPFQWSDHILSREGSLAHREYLCLKDKVPSEEVAQTLLEALGDEGSICTYTTFENQVISHLANHVPRYRSELLALLDRCWDLCDVIRTEYYHPQFHGSFSIKNVLPVLVPSLSYENLPIQDGEQAGVEYLRTIDPETPPVQKERIRRDLLEYCGRDTLAMGEIREELLKRSIG